MQHKLLTILFAGALVAAGVRAQDANSAPAAPTPNTIPPSSAQIQTTTPAAQAPGATMSAPQAAPAPNQVIYSPRLPSAQELTNAAAAQGVGIDQIVQTANQITVVYRYSNGQTNTVAYQLLPTNPAPTATTTTVVVPTQAPTVIYQQTPTVVYEQSPRVVYYRSYDPYWYYPPVSLSLGFGYYRGWGGYHGGWHGGGYGHHGRW